MKGILATLLILILGGTTLAQEDLPAIYELDPGQTVEIGRSSRSITFRFEVDDGFLVKEASGEANLVRGNVYQDRSIIYTRVRGRTRKSVCRITFTFSGENLENLTVAEDRSCLTNPASFPVAGRYKLRE